ncbi:MAG: hypothetical protein U7123_21645 [Potamolinea sp.]
MEKTLSICKNARERVEEVWQNREKKLDINADDAGNGKILKAFFYLSILKPIVPFLAFSVKALHHKSLILDALAAKIQFPRFISR